MMQMRWLKKCLTCPVKFTDRIIALGAPSPNWTPQKFMKDAVNTVYPDEKLLFRTRVGLPALLQQFGTTLPGNSSEPKCNHGSPFQTVQHCCLTACRGFASSAGNDQPLSRDWFARLWNENKRQIEVRRRGKGKRQLDVRVEDGSTVYHNIPDLPFLKSVSKNLPRVEKGALVKDLASWFPFLKSSVWKKPSQAEQHAVNDENETMRVQPISKYYDENLSPNSPEEVKLGDLLSRSNLVITRDIEWANIMFAFEQESRYVILDPYYPHPAAGFIQEKSNIIFRQLLRGRRPFVAYIFDAMGKEIFRVRRPFWWINSTIYAEVNGKEVGVVHRRWHLWRRIYDLYLGNKQFAVVENPGFWNWTFTLKDEDENVLAQIDRDWRGLGLELFTDAGQYVIQFGNTGSNPITEAASRIQELQVARPLSLSERAVALALAISLDNDYFSRNRSWAFPIFIAGE
ncbi:hypothetical protein Cni_G13077 [Canna indica]|uniref:Phospholipid scramblase n=1 Tax=Canna indica TaxID=4628 RepID=A0AAQ3Q9J9_9LILI|nr:hypothetical protein Cni_G13077 [Canna indica]